MKRIFVIATGGTIAGVGDAGGQGYRSGQLGVGALLESVPELSGRVQVRTHQLANIGSQDMSEALWHKLAALVAQELASAECDGVVVIHGTDTLEETAFFLHCVLPPSAKPVVLTGSMRPATAAAADGPRNLLDAFTVAASDAAIGHGVQVVFAGHIFSAVDVFKADTLALDAFRSDAGCALGQVAKGRAAYAVRCHDLAGTAATAAAPVCEGTGVAQAQLATAGTLPQVALVTAYVGQQPDHITALVRLGCRGIVYAGLGNGNLSAAMLAALTQAVASGVVVVRASRVPQGGISAHGEVDDAAHGFICAGMLGAPKARILLNLALAHGCSAEGVRRWFAPYALPTG